MTNHNLQRLLLMVECYDCQFPKQFVQTNVGGISLITIVTHELAIDVSRTIYVQLA